MARRDERHPGAVKQAQPTLTFLLDVDNTLLDNDRLKVDLDTRLRECLGGDKTDRFWVLYEEVRKQEDYVDFPATVQRLVDDYHDPGLGKRLTKLLDDFPFKTYVYAGVFDTLDYLKRLGTVVILSDGDSVFQPHKIQASGLAQSVDGHVLIYIHKEAELPKVFERYPAEHYVVVDDKPRIISAFERECPTLFTTVLVLQGKYARPDEFEPRPDYVVAHIADLQDLSREQFLTPTPTAGQAG